MKHLLICQLLYWIAYCQLTAQSDIRITGGYALSSLIQSPDYTNITPPNIDWRSQYLVGAQYRYKLRHWYLTAGIEHCRRGDKNQITGVRPEQTSVRELGYASLPLTVGYNFLPRFSVFAGGYYARLLGYANRFYTQQDVELGRYTNFIVQTKPLHNDLGFLVGARWQVLPRWDLALEYGRGTRPFGMSGNTVTNQWVQLRVGYSLLSDTVARKRSMVSTRPEQFGATAGYAVSSIEPAESRFFGNLGTDWAAGYSAGFFYRRHFDKTYLNVEALFTRKGAYTVLDLANVSHMRHQIDYLEFPVTVGQDLPFRLSVFGGLYVGLVQWQQYNIFLRKTGKTDMRPMMRIAHFQDFGLLGGLRWQPDRRLGFSVRYCAGLGQTYFFLATSVDSRRGSDDRYLRWIQLNVEYSLVSRR